MSMAIQSTSPSATSFSSRPGSDPFVSSLTRRPRSLTTRTRSSRSVAEQGLPARHADALEPALPRVEVGQEEVQRQDSGTTPAAGRGRRCGRTDSGNCSRPGRPSRRCGPGSPWGENFSRPLISTMPRTPPRCSGRPGRSPARGGSRVGRMIAPLSSRLSDLDELPDLGPCPRAGSGCIPGSRCRVSASSFLSFSHFWQFG